MAKRILALLIVSALLLGLYCPITVNAEIQSESTKLTQLSVLYEDDFSTDENYTSALGSTTWQSYARPIWEDGKLISGDYESASDAKFALLNGLGAESLTNYTVEADITAGTANDRNCYVAIYGRTTDDKQAGSAYQFSYLGKSGKFLLRSNATTASGNKADLVTNVAISKCFSDYTKGDAIRMSITAITYDDYVNLICRATYNGVTKEVINYKDYREGRYTCGLPGFGLQQQNSSLDNVKVAKVKVVKGTILYEDDFTTDTNYTAAVGSHSWQTGSNVPPIWDEENGRLISDSIGNHNFTLLNGLGANSWTNYTVEADINTGSTSGRTCYVAAYGRTSGNNTQGKSYQFICTGAGGTFQLRKFSDAALFTVNINKFFTDYDYNNSIHMAITAITYSDYVHLICKATYSGVTKIIFNYKDTSDERYTSGLPGFGLQKQNSWIDNVVVSTVDESELETGAVLYEDDFTTNGNYTAAVGSTNWQTSPYVPLEWNEENGQLISNSTGNQNFTLLNGLGADNWTNYTVEADITASYAEKNAGRACYVAAYGTTSGNNNQGKAYQFICTGAGGKFQLRKYSDTASLVANISDFFADYDYNNSIRMSITAITYDYYVNIICTATYNGETKEIFNYKDTDATRYTSGMPGFGLQKENCSLDNVRVVKTQPVLYEDNFATGEKYVASCGATWQSPNTNVPLIWNASGKLISDSTGNHNFTLLNGLGAESWTDYTVEADITAGTANDRNCYVAAYGRTTGDKISGDSYQFAYQGKSGKFLLRSIAPGTSGGTINYVTGVKITDYFSNYAKGDTIRMSITAITYEDYVNLICKVTYDGETKEVINYNDTTKRYTSGMPGFGLQQENSSLDNVKVTKYQPVSETVLYEDDFTTEYDYTSALGTSWQSGSYVPPIWDGETGKLISNTTGNNNFALLNGLGAENWTNYTVEADITAGTVNDRLCYVAAYGRTTGGKVYGDAYQFGIQGSSGNLMLRRTATTSSRNSAEIKKLPCSYFFDNFTKGDTIRLSITAVTDATGVTLICKATYQGETEVIFNYRDTSSGRHTYGMPGFGLQQENSSLDNVKVYYGIIDKSQKPYYSDMSIVEVNDTYNAPDTGLTTTTYSDNFEDEEAGTDPSHWIEEPNVNAWQVYNRSGKLVYGTQNTGLTYTWLHTFESDPVVSMDFMVRNVDAKARLEFLTRYTQADEHGKVAVGYDASAQKWYIYSCQGEDFLPRKVYSASTYELTAEKWYNVTIKENGNKVWVYVDNELVIADAGVEMTSFGRIGVLAEHMYLYVDNVNYSMPHSGAVNDGIMEEVWDDAVYSNFNNLEIESLGDDKLIGYRSNARYISEDKGATWSLNQTNYYTELKAGDNASYTSALQLGNGEFLMVYADTYDVLYSDDNMATWKVVGCVSTELATLNSVAHGAIKVAKSAVIHTNSLKKFTLKDGTVRIFLPIAINVDTQNARSNGMYTRIFYSDDFGVTWNESTNDTRDVTPGYEANSTTETYTWAEAKMWQCSDGTLCLSNTRDYYGLTYTESHDGGVTWEGLKSLPYIQNAVSSHDVVEDPNNPGTYYMVCLQDKCETDGWACPRERLILAKSTDGRNWKYVMDIERYTNYEFDGYWLSGTNRDLFQMLDPSINIIDGYMYISFGRSYKQLVNADHNYQQMRLVRIEMDKLPETKGWDASNVADPTRASKLEIETEAQTVFGLNDTFSMDGTIRETDFDGNVAIKSMELFDLVSETPDMSKSGIYTVTLMNKYGTSISYDIEVSLDTEYFCLDDQDYSVSSTGTVTINGVVRQNGYTLTQAGDYTVVINGQTKILVLYYKGDITGNKEKGEKANILDLVQMKKGLASNKWFTKAGKKAADMNDDKAIDATDITLLIRMLLQN